MEKTTKTDIWIIVIVVIAIAIFAFFGISSYNNPTETEIDRINKKYDKQLEELKKNNEEVERAIRILEKHKED